MPDTSRDPLLDFRSQAPQRAFLDWPVVTNPAEWQADIAIIGIPQSEPYPHDPCPNDQARAPDIVRGQSSQFCDGPERWDFDIGAPLQECLPPRCIDIGNLVWGDEPFDAHFQRVAEAARRLWSSGAMVLAIGGDHGVTIPLLQALDVLQRPVYIVHIDAHLDWRDDVAGVKRGYSSPLRRASELPWIAGMTQIGLRGTGSARRGEVEAALAYGSTLVPAAELHERGIDAIIDDLPRDHAFFVTIDADGLDPALMPGVMGPVPGGVRPEQVKRLLKRLAERGPVVGMDIVEIAPSFDFANQLTSITAGRLFINLIGAMRHRWR
ncbi:arginase family protein [Dongia soli]|uniref:Arginase family protein n=1 Tax=Dongia soli TaxID=600628 RepID=A0ABU5EEV7_9PROT|nr:arginase family protein [Dongia soli]MDY0884924.1 arginase family protein [Dongia soli]